MRISKSVLRCGAMAVLAAVVSLSAIAQETNNPPAAGAVPPPAAPAKRSAAELEKLVAPIALYPDPLIATILPASVYPLEIVQAARFVADTNNLAKLDEQPWDDNVKALAQVPDALKKLNDDLQWTIDLGEAFLGQDKELMDAIQRLRLKAQQAGTLQTTPQQVVVVTNTIVETAVQQEVVMVTNTIVQIVPADPEIIYVPQYNPVVVYAPPPAYYDPWVTFGAGVTVGVIIGNSCDWYHGGCYHGHYDYHHNTKIKVEGDVNIDRGDRVANRPDRGQKWQPDQSRLNRSGAAGANSTRSQEARGWGSGARPSTGAVGARPSTGAVAPRPSTGTVSPRPSTGTVPSGGRPSTGSGPQVMRGSQTPTPSANRPSAGGGPEVMRGTPSSSPSVNRPSTPAGGARPAPSQGSSSRTPSGYGGGNNAFGGVGNGSSARQASSRGSMSRGGGGGVSRGGGGRGGGGRR